MNDALAMDTLRRYVCAHCYGHLTLFADPETRWRIECQNCGPASGFVTRRYAESRKEASHGEKLEVDQLLERLGLVVKPRRSIEQNLRELGF
jgi:hypothetical protein